MTRLARTVRAMLRRFRRYGTTYEIYQAPGGKEGYLAVIPEEPYNPEDRDAQQR